MNRLASRWHRFDEEFTATGTSTHQLRVRLTEPGSAEFYFYRAIVFELPE